MTAICKRMRSIVLATDVIRLNDDMQKVSKERERESGDTRSGEGEWMIATIDEESHAPSAGIALWHFKWKWPPPPQPPPSPPCLLFDSLSAAIRFIFRVCSTAKRGTRAEQLLKREDRATRRLLFALSFSLRYRLPTPTLTTPVSEPTESKRAKKYDTIVQEKEK